MGQLYETCEMAGATAMINDTIGVWTGLRSFCNAKCDSMYFFNV